MNEEFTEDKILNGKIRILQPRDGYRVALDPIIFASYIKTKFGNKILDVGCGVGTVSLILKYKNPLVKVTAIDINEKMCSFCKENAKRNSIDISVINESIESTESLGKDFDVVVTNPPFFEKKSSRLSEKKLLANFETIPLYDWITFCLKRLKNGGKFAIIHLASRLDDILYAIKDKIGAIEIFPIHSKTDSDANRIVITGIKGRNSQIKMHSGLIVHNENGKYTEKVAKILCGVFEL